MKQYRIHKDRSNPVLATSASPALVERYKDLSQAIVADIRKKMKEHPQHILRRESFGDSEVPVLTTIGGDLIAAEITAALLYLNSETAEVVFKT